MYLQLIVYHTFMYKHELLNYLAIKSKISTITSYQAYC